MYFAVVAPSYVLQRSRALKYGCDAAQILHCAVKCEFVQICNSQHLHHGDIFMTSEGSREPQMGLGCSSNDHYVLMVR